MTEFVAAAGVLFSISISWLMLLTHIGPLMVFLTVPFTECRSQDRLAGGFDRSDGSCRRFR
jgi:hypothetical protein